MNIDKLKTLIHNQFSDGQKKIPVYVNETNNTNINAIFLFFNPDVTNNLLAIGKHNQFTYIVDNVEVVCRHNDYTRSRELAFKAIKYISVSSKNYQGLYIVPQNTPPQYSGLDEVTGGYMWTFQVNLKGNE